MFCSYDFIIRKLNDIYNNAFGLLRNREFNQTESISTNIQSPLPCDFLSIYSRKDRKTLAQIKSEGLNSNKYHPYKLAYNMEQRVPDHRINDTVFAVEQTEYKTEAAIEQEATEQDKRR